MSSFSSSDTAVVRSASSLQRRFLLGAGMGGTAAGISSLFFNLCTGWIVTHFGYSVVLILAGLLAPIGALVLFLLVGEVRRINIPINAIN